MVEQEEIIYNGEEGIIEYDTENVSDFKVIHPNNEVVEKVTAYLTSEREFKIPESDRIDDYRIDKARPIDHPVLFSLAMSSLKSYTGIGRVLYNPYREQKK